MSERIRRLEVVSGDADRSTSAEPADEVLVSRVCDGDTAALEALYSRYARVVYSFAARIVGDGSTAEEILQEAFVRTWRQAETYRTGRGSFASWLLSITHNLAIDELRRRQRRPQRFDGADVHEVMDGLVDDAASVEEAAEAALLRERVGRAMASLPDAQRVAIEYAFYHSMSQREIAAHLGEPLGTIKTRLRLGMRKLKDALADEEIIGGR
ncbi:MAG TPA: sigma-70 family RNA polymerase sigma factor [Thermomicrobiales bacterium]|nr:sigma-70 family RNA polymerase sigma factor [Thermomicrobiales bacterium]HQZ91246.1 sigma-70 family RNA polymerase sigma factor [Thermomicrobiales bacterium]HRA32702.1 sigma-70 family RNA polymerase sigma factor [Thermomicrobiales bacterium]